MKTPGPTYLTIALLVAIMGWSANRQQMTNDPSPQVRNLPRLVNTCLITKNVERLVQFYEPILGLKAQWAGKDYAEFHTGGGVLAIFSEPAQEKYIPGSTEAGKNQSVILQFRVTNVDREYTRLQSLVKVWVKPPTTQPWGTRSIYFRDPDGNLADFFAPIKTQ